MHPTSKLQTLLQTLFVQTQAEKNTERETHIPELLIYIFITLQGATATTEEYKEYLYLGEKKSYNSLFKE